jgi:membrane-bound serine protease (ClpP class)
MTLSVTSAAVVFFTVWFALKARRRPVVSGHTDIIGASGTALADFEREGWAQVRGETWRVLSAAPVASGQDVRVTGIDGLTLRVEPDDRHGGKA